MKEKEIFYKSILMMSDNYRSSKGIQKNGTDERNARITEDYNTRPTPRIYTYNTDNNAAYHGTLEHTTLKHEHQRKYGKVVSDAVQDFASGKSALDPVDFREQIKQNPELARGIERAEFGLDVRSREEVKSPETNSPTSEMQHKLRSRMADLMENATPEQRAALRQQYLGGYNRENLQKNVENNTRSTPEQRTQGYSSGENRDSNGNNSSYGRR